MEKEIKRGVRLIIDQNQVFQSTVIRVTFARPKQTGQAAKRALLSYLLAVSSPRYPNQRAVAQELLGLAGASYDSQVLTYGSLDLVTLTLRFVKPGLLADSEQIVTQALAFLNEMIFHYDWLADDQSGNIEVERQNLEQAILRRQEDKMTWALDLSRPYTFVLPEQQTSHLGTVAEVTALTAADLAASHAQLLQEDQVTVAVIGAVDEAAVAAAVAAWDWPADRQVVPFSFALPAFSQPSQHQLVQDHLAQGVLLQHYQLPDRPAAWTPLQMQAVAAIANEVFGGGPASRLFTEVRERAGLAYQAASFYQRDLGLITVLIGTGADSLRQARTAVAEQLAFLQSDALTEAAVTEAKQSVMNRYQIRLDQPSFRTLSMTVKALTGQHWTDEAYVAALAAVSQEEVRAFFAELTLQTDFILTPKELAHD
ncbi:insulinase family protein [Leuconostocaceae bacterium ESL0958]|nr:insulinase family protein [Leuconostocaceae bacterium ESL0958]